MQVFKFGGASIKDARAISNVANIIRDKAEFPYIVVVSAMGKTTNSLEELLKASIEENPQFPEKLKDFKAFHYQVAKDLFGVHQSSIMDELENLLFDLEFYLEKSTEQSYDFLYDQVVSFGELLSTKIISRYLNEQGITNKWIDARNFVLTDQNHRSAEVFWDKTTDAIDRKLKGLVQEMPVITQGFMGATTHKVTTTLGREGSDYSAGIFAYALDAEKVVVWKDVPGVLNADPNVFKDTIKFDTLSYQEAIEMTFYGAKVLHPRTIKPLQNKCIPLQVRSFINPEEAGTAVYDKGQSPTSAPVIIFKAGQMLVKLSTLDYAFIAEENLSKIFSELAKAGLTMNLMNTSAITFAFCADKNDRKMEQLSEALKEDFGIEKEEELELLTIRHFNRTIIDQMTKDKQVLLENSDGETIQMVLRRHG